MDLCYEWCFVLLAGWLSALFGKNFNVRCYMQTFQPNLFIPTMLVGTSDFYHCIPLSLTLTVPRGHKVSTNQNLGFIFLHTFHWSGLNLMWWWSNSSWTSWGYFWMIDWKYTSVAIISQRFQSIWMEFGVLLRLVGVLSLILILILIHVHFISKYNWYNFIKKNLILACIQIFTDWFLSNVVWW